MQRDICHTCKSSNASTANNTAIQQHNAKVKPSAHTAVMIIQQPIAILIQQNVLDVMQTTQHTTPNALASTKPVNNVTHKGETHLHITMNKAKHNISILQYNLNKNQAT